MTFTLSTITDILPTELIWDIFQLACISNAVTNPYRDLDEPSEVEFGLAVEHSRDVGPVKLSHVCRDWRAAALRCPPLWSLIFANRVSHEAKIANFLRRSRNHPLDIIIVGLPGNEVVSWLELLLPELHRWKRVQINVPTLPLESLLSRVFSQPFESPQLELLKIHDPLENLPFIYHFSGTPPSFLMRSPALQTLIIRHVDHNWGTFYPSTRNIRHLELEWNNVRTRVLPTVDSILALLHQMPLLEHLHLGLPPLGELSDTIQHKANKLDYTLPIQLYHLSYLSFECTQIMGGCSAPWLWLRCIFAPQLEELKITHFDPSIPNHVFRDLPDGCELIPCIPSLRIFRWSPFQVYCRGFFDMLFTVAPNITTYVLYTYPTEDYVDRLVLLLLIDEVGARRSIERIVVRKPRQLTNSLSCDVWHADTFWRNKAEEIRLLVKKHFQNANIVLEGEVRE